MKKIVGIITLLLICANMSAQTDFGLWEMLKFNKPINNKVSTLLAFEHRTKNNAADLDIAIIIPGITYKLTPWMSVGAMYNYVIKPGNGNNYHNINPLVTFSKSTDHWTFSLREMWQYTVNTEVLALRSKGTVKYKIPDSIISPRVEFEFYNDTNRAFKGEFGNPLVNLASSMGLYAAKNIVGVDIKASPRASVMVNYLYYYLGVNNTDMTVKPGRHCIQTGLTINL